jgi:type II secretory pathway component PulC
MRRRKWKWVIFGLAGLLGALTLLGGALFYGKGEEEFSLSSLSPNKKTPPSKKPKKDQTPTQRIEVTLPKKLVTESFQNLPQVLVDARAIPVLKRDGSSELTGFRLLQIKEGSIYTRVGLKEDDLVRELNGEPLTSPAKILEIYSGIKELKEFSLLVERRGGAIEIRVKIE